MDAVKKKFSIKDLENLSGIKAHTIRIWETYNNLLSERSFREIFYEIFIPLLTELGLLWQTDTISPAHEHFITSLVKQKILINTEKLQMISPSNNSKIFVLYLPENEIHEIGLLYLNYEIILHGYQSIYLGQTVPLDCLGDLLKYYDNLNFVSYFTVSPTHDKLENYIKQFGETIGSKSESTLWILGRQLQYLEDKELPSYVKGFHSIDAVVKEL